MVMVAMRAWGRASTRAQGGMRARTWRPAIVSACPANDMVAVVGGGGEGGVERKKAKVPMEAQSEQERCVRECTSVQGLSLTHRIMLR